MEKYGSQEKEGSKIEESTIHDKGDESNIGATVDNFDHNKIEQHHQDKDSTQNEGIYSPQHRDLHKERQQQLSQRIEHLKETHQLPEGMKPITKEDMKNFIAHQNPIHANEDVERSLTAKVVMSAMINEIKQGELHDEDKSPLPEQNK